MYQLLGWIFSPHFSAFFRFFPLFFALHFSLRFDLVIFASKRTKRSEIQVYFLVFFAFFHFFSLNFLFASIFLLNFRLFCLRFRFRFLVFRIEVNHVKSGFFFASKRSEIFASISNFASEAKVRAHPTPNTVFSKPPTCINDEHFLWVSVQ